jgi:dipeptidyl aminopeptidase/acylaminoacyl peptidase
MKPNCRFSPTLFATLISILCASLPTRAQSLAPSRAAAILDSMPHAKRIEQASISPDGTQVAYIIAGELAVVPSNGGTPQPVTVEGKLAPRDCSWSADSKQITFVADLPGDIPSAQIWTAAIDGSAPVKRAEVKGYAAAPSFSPDGSKIALLYIEGIPRTAGPLQPMTPLAGVIGSQIYEQRLTTIDLKTNTLTQVSPADVYIYEYDWTPDSQGWVATAAHGAGDANWYVARLYGINAQSGELREIYAPKWQLAEPHISPDGKYVAFIEGLMSDESVNGGEIYVVPASGGAARNLTPNIHSSPSQLAWTAPDRITFAQNLDGYSGLATVSANGGAVQTLWTGEEVLGVTPSPGASFSSDGKSTALIRQSGATPPEVWAGPIGRWKQLTTVNAAIKPAWGELHNFHWTNDGMQIEGWLMLPKDYAPGKTYPLVVNVHGGPSSACGPHFDARTMGPESALGYFAFCPNPRGSYGQGESFTRGNVKDFGGGDFRDIMAGIDAIAKQYPIDPHRLGIRGHSYGGYMTMWAETQTHRFAAAVAGAGLSDWLSYYGVNDIDEWMIPFFGASIYDDPAVYAKSDPMHFVKAVTTPTLILVGDRDGEVPMEQSVEWWHALTNMKVPTQFVVYADEGHMFIKPADARDYNARSLEWLDDWFGKAATQK